MSIILDRPILNTTPSIPSSKSMLHRMLICAAFSRKSSVVLPVNTCDDISATVDCLNALGADIRVVGDKYVVSPIVVANESAVLNCRESATTLRLLMPIACSLGINIKWLLGGRLPDRNNTELFKILSDNGVNIKVNKNTVETSGKFFGKCFSVDASVTSQFLSGILIFCAYYGGTVFVPDDTVSKPYIYLTLSVLSDFGAEYKSSEGKLVYTGSGGFCPDGTVIAEPDFSSAAYHIAASAVTGEELTFGNFRQFSEQADYNLLNVLKNCGVAFIFSDNKLKCNGKLKSSFSASVRDCPDLAPLLAALACSVKGKSTISDVNRLRYKESDRVAEIVGMVTSFGGKVDVIGDSIVIESDGEPIGCVIDSSDHRIVMSASILALVCTGKVTIINEECVAKSYPDYFKNIFRSC